MQIPLGEMALSKARLMFCRKQFCAEVQRILELALRFLLEFRGQIFPKPCNSILLLKPYNIEALNPFLTLNPRAKPAKKAFKTEPQRVVSSLKGPIRVSIGVPVRTPYGWLSKFGSLWGGPFYKGAVIFLGPEFGELPARRGDTTEHIGASLKPRANSSKYCCLLQRSYVYNIYIYIYPYSPECWPCIPPPWAQALQSILC